MKRIPVRLLDASVSMAAGNWLEWREDFEHHGDQSLLPVLASEDRHRAFLQQYGVLRGVPDRVRSRIRSKMLAWTDFRKALKGHSGESLDALAERLSTCVWWKDDDGSWRKLGQERAYLSKLAAFALPGHFVAWDQFGRKGTQRIMELHTGDRPTEYKDYASFLRDVNALWEDSIGEQIRIRQGELSQGSRLRVPIAATRFGKRVLDHLLMIAGGRWERTLGGI